MKKNLIECCICLAVALVCIAIAAKVTGCNDKKEDVIQIHPSDIR